MRVRLEVKREENETMNSSGMKKGVRQKRKEWMH